MGLFFLFRALNFGPKLKIPNFEILHFSGWATLQALGAESKFFGHETKTVLQSSIVVAT